MRITVFEVREDERDFLCRMAQQENVTLCMTEQPLGEETLSFAEGSDGVSILGHSHLDKALLKKLKVHTEDTAAENLPGEEDDNNE